MRELTIAECEVVSGGHTHLCGSACTITELSGVTVTGPGGGGGGWYPPLPGGGGAGGGGGFGGGGEDTTPDTLPDCVTDAPVITDEDQFMKNLEILTNELRGAFNDVPGNDPIDASRYEYGVFIFEINGVIGYGNIQTSYNNSLVHVTAAGIPDGARIVAFMHNHPDGTGDDRYPSNHNGGDWDQRDALVAKDLGRNITIDPNMLLVIYTNQDDKTRIYDKSDKNKESAACAIN